MSENKKAGPVTFAVGLIFFGAVLLISNFKGLSIFESTLKYWPVLLIGLGVEYFVRSYLNQKGGSQESTRFHFPTVMVILLVALVAFGGQQVSGLLKNREIASYIREAVAGTSYNYELSVPGRVIEYNPQIVNLSLSDLDGKVNIVSGTDNKIKINATVVAWGPSPEEARRRAEMVKIRIDESKTINVTRLRDQIENVRRQAEVIYHVTVPKGLKVEVKGSNDNIKADNLENDLYLKSSGGETSVTNIRGKVEYDGEYGNVDFRNISGDLTVNLNNGNVSIDDITGTIKADCENGKIDVASTQPVKTNYSLSSRSGEIKLSIPQTSNATISVKSQNGHISGSLTLSMEENSSETHDQIGSAVLGTGESSIDIRNEMGSIIVDKN